MGVLFKRYTHFVLGVSMKYLKDEELAKDMAMQVFEKLLNNLKKHEVQNFKSWLHVLCKNECLMYLRKRKTLGVQITNEIMETDFMEYQIAEHHMDEESNLEEDLTKLESCIETLKSEQSVCIRLFYLEKKPYDEISSSTGFDLKKVKSYIQNGRRNLKICIENSSESE